MGLPSAVMSVSPVLVVGGWATVLLILDAFLPRKRRGITPALAAAGLLAAFGLLAWLYVTSRQDGFGRLIPGDCLRMCPTCPSAPVRGECLQGMVRVDGLGLFFQGVILLSATVTVGLAFDYLKRMNLERGEFYSLVLFAAAGMMLMAVANDLVIVFLALELLSIPLYVLAGLARP